MATAVAAQRTAAQDVAQATPAPSSRTAPLDTGRAEHVLRGHTGPVTGVALAADGETAVSVGRDGTVRWWRVRDGALIRTVAAGRGELYDVAVSRTGQVAVAGAGDQVPRYDLASGRALSTLRVLPAGAGTAGSPPRACSALAFSPDGSHLAAGCLDGRIRLWRTSTGALERVIEARFVVDRLAWTPDGRGLASAAGRVTLWDAATGAARREYRGHRGLVRGLAVAGDGAWLATGGLTDKTVRVWDLADGTEQRAMTAQGMPVWTPSGRQVTAPLALPVTAAAVAPGGRLLTGGADRVVRVWDLATGAPVRVLVGHQGAVSSLAVSADGRRAVSAGLDRTVQVWALAGGAP